MQKKLLLTAALHQSEVEIHLREQHHMIHSWKWKKLTICCIHHSHLVWNYPRLQGLILMSELCKIPEAGMQMPKWSNAPKLFFSVGQSARLCGDHQVLVRPGRWAHLGKGLHACTLSTVLWRTVGSAHKPAKTDQWKTCAYERHELCTVKLQTLSHCGYTCQSQQWQHFLPQRSQHVWAKLHRPHVAQQQSEKILWNCPMCKFKAMPCTVCWLGGLALGNTCKECTSPLHPKHMLCDNVITFFLTEIKFNIWSTHCHHSTLWNLNSRNHYSILLLVLVMAVRVLSSGFSVEGTLFSASTAPCPGDTEVKPAQKVKKRHNDCTSDKHIIFSSEM